MEYASLMKEDFVPEGTSRFLHAAAPVIAVLPVLLAFGVLPLGPDFTVWGVQVRPEVASIDAGILFVLAMGSVAVYGVAIAGWTGNNKFSLLGALRAAAQMISAIFHGMYRQSCCATRLIFPICPDIIG